MRGLQTILFRVSNKDQQVINKEQKGYHKLLVWQRSKELVLSIYKVTHTFPKSEEFGLKSQIRRAAVSIVSNIAEGYSRNSKKDNKRFVEIAIGSLFELESDLEISKDLSFISQKDYILVETKRAEVGFLLNRYHKSF